MEYHEAVLAAKSNPGSVMTRNQTGDGFIVRLVNGKVLGSAVDSKPDPVELRILELKEEKCALEMRVKELEGELLEASARIGFHKEQVDTLTSQLANLKSKVAKVSDKEWTRINEEERKHLDEVERLRASLRHGSYNANNAFVVCASTDGQD